MAPAGTSRDHGVLFARAYLDSKLAKLKEDQQAYLLETVKEWFGKMDDSSLIAYVASFIGPVLDVLGHIRSELGENLLSLYSDRSRKKAISLCYVVGPHESLDQTSKGRNYAVSLIIALRKIGLKWGILTNGLLWRLYCVEEKAPFETYSQVDLGEALRTRDLKEVFLLAEFFSATAFLPSETGKCPLDANRHESDEETREIEKHLESKIENILGKICMGFIESEGKKSYTDDEKRVVFNNSIYLIYRILFVLYAEARGFLPLQKREYYEKSMEKLMSIAKENHSKGITDPHSREMWNSLYELFDWINRGNHALLIPPYNGGLFDDGEKPYLANHVINDAYLSEALFSLGFREEHGKTARIDYNDLSVRPLGSLYEGILEYQLFLAPERMVRRKEEKVYRFIPETLAGKITRTDILIEKGDIYFSQSSEERKLTGSYYTPEDVVQYIVENSLGQYLVDVGKELCALVNTHAEAHATAVDDKERRRVEKYIDTELLSFIENRILSIKVLDPAMGSGHFLVNAAHFLSNFIVESLYLTEWENDSVDTSILSWRRRVVEKCIFGVDLNDLATELAKLSLWLITADSGKPLTFLDHHLRTGNSLLGVALDNLGILPENSEKDRLEKAQTTLNYPIFEREFIPKVLRAFKEMEESSEEIADVERKKGKFREWEKLKRGLQSVADTWLANFFGHQTRQREYQSLLRRAFEEKEVSVDRQVVTIANASENRFFHWWLEFPEVFKSGENRNGGGFDIVIGNPPYGAELSESEKGFISRKFRHSRSNKNTALIFIEKSLELMDEQGYLGMIVPKSLAFSQIWKSGRELISEHLTKVVDVSKAFEDVLLEQIIIILDKSVKSEEYILQDTASGECIRIQKRYIAQTDSIILHGERKDLEIFRKMNEPSKYLSNITTTSRGLPFQKYLMKQKTKYPVIKGKTISRYNIRLSNEFLPEKIVEGSKTKLKLLLQPKIVSQRIVAHVTKPNDRIIIMSALDQEGLIDVDTVENTISTDGRYSLEFLLCLLNSKLVSWYAYRYIFSKAIRTMDFDSYYVGKIPRPNIGVDNEAFIKLARKMLSLNKRLNELGETNAAERVTIELEMKKTDSEIDALVFKIYGINEDEKRVIESGQDN